MSEIKNKTMYYAFDEMILSKPSVHTAVCML